MLVELGVVEQRTKAVYEVLEGATVTDVALRYGVARQTVHEWLHKFATKGFSGLVDRSSRPTSCPHQMPAEIEAAVVEMRRSHPGYGPLTILYELERQGLAQLPGRSSIYRALVRHGLIVPAERRRSRSDYKRWERSRAMELWQMDVVGGFYLQDGTELKAITGIDDHSRYCVSARLVVPATSPPVCEAQGPKEAVGSAGATGAVGLPARQVPFQTLGRAFTSSVGLNGGGSVAIAKLSLPTWQLLCECRHARYRFGRPRRGEFLTLMFLAP
jgi:transposase